MAVPGNLGGLSYARRKEIYEWWKLETKADAGRAAGMNVMLSKNVDDNLSPTFTKDASAKTGIDWRTIQRSIRRSEYIAEWVRLTEERVSAQVEPKISRSCW